MFFGFPSAEGFQPVHLLKDNSPSQSTCKIDLYVIW